MAQARPQKQFQSTYNFRWGHTPCIASQAQSQECQNSVTHLHHKCQTVLLACDADG